MELVFPWKSVRAKQQPVDPEALLLQRIAQGDRHALADLYARYQRPLFHYVVQLASDQGVAEEILQDTFLAVWKSAGSYQGRSTVRTWLIGIARRQAHNALRRSALPLAGEAELAGVEAPDPEPEAAALAAADREVLAAAMAKLSPVHREILILTFVHGLSYPELAEVLAVPAGTVKSRLSNAKQALRKLLVHHGDTETRRGHGG
ncbi:MAG: sigma-70 family RNA polymerase sigma factor [Chloroflexi bacterium]|nr:sigma-70 family RNA polymerase sigma factor [Chloroflexota bacterium]